MLLQTRINLSLGHRPSLDWRRPHRRLDQIRTDMGPPRATAWRNAIRKGYHPEATQRTQLAMQQ